MPVYLLSGLTGILSLILAVLFPSEIIFRF